LYPAHLRARGFELLDPYQAFGEACARSFDGASRLGTSKVLEANVPQSAASA
jgi:hypothetical protein